MRKYLFKVLHFYDFYEHVGMSFDTCYAAMNSKAMQTLLETKEKFDVILLEQFNTDCMLAVAWKLQAPFIGMCSSSIFPWHYNRVGQPQIPSFMPSLHAEHGDQMTFLQRFSNWVSINAMKFLYR